MLKAFKDLFFIDPIDRTFHKNFENVDIKRCDIVLPTNITSPSLQECIDDSLENINGQNVSLLWSGGIDSTLVFYALLDSGIEFSVLGDDRSVKEHPSLADKIKQGYFKTAHWVDLSALNDQSIVDRFLVTGEIGDQCVGSDKLLTLPHEVRIKPYTAKYASTDWNIFTETVKDILNRSDLTVGEMTWAFNFFWKYDHVIRRIREQLPNNSVYHFFNTDKFQCYAMNNYQESTAFVKNTDYKAAYKQWIFDHDQDDFYRKNKVKYGSLRHLLAKNHV